MEKMHYDGIYGEDVPHNMYCILTVVSKINSVYKRRKNYHTQAYVEECKYTDPEGQHCSMLSIMINNLRSKRRHEEDFVT